MSLSEGGCERSAHCLSFRRPARTPCSSCRADIRGNHFHATEAQYRLCGQCFFEALENIALGVYAPSTNTGEESTECVNFPECAQGGLYTKFREKLCDGCGLYPPTHFHDVSENIRLCFPCFMSRRDHYEAMQFGDAR